LARLESLEQRLAGIDRLETRIADVEEMVSTNVTRETVVSSAGDQNSNKLDLVTGQLNNLVARMTLVENKLVMLQSAEVFLVSLFVFLFKFVLHYCFFQISTHRF